jgi:uncharacterized Zn-binding protein involved in type VI secretion
MIESVRHMPPAARLGDMHVCPMVTPPPHVGGPILPACCPTVLIGGMPAARVGDILTCVGPPDVIAMGSPTVLIGYSMAARIGDPTAHGGVIMLGCPTVLIGVPGAGEPVNVPSGEGSGGDGSPADDNSFENLISGVCNVAQQFAALLSSAAFGKPFCPV